ncbi:MAG: hypothetical protein LBR90_04860 [Elusimicrobiota bacterium]|jgi:formate hydrogenlyase subunit 3/multisubunit Na+/H+ antiporter MnhD subunit|nr:hypothetical protein [Elusimicrobiota bacterium]
MNMLPVIFPLACAALAAVLYKFLPRAAKFLVFAGTSLAFLSVFTLNNIYTLQLADLAAAPDIFSLTLAAFIAFYALLSGVCAIKEEDSPLFHINLLLSAAFALGAVLAADLKAMLFFWEALLITLFLFLLPYNKQVAVKAFLINAAGDVFLLAGIALFARGPGAAAFILMLTGAAAKAGALPFHSWIAPAVKAAPTAFSAMMPGAVEKLLAVFLMGKMFTMLWPALPAAGTFFGCVLGALSVVAAAAHMLKFEDLKNLLAWAVVMQIGLLILGLCARGAGDTFYTLNHGLFKAALLACAFFAAGALQAGFGGTALADLKGAGRRDVFSFIVLIICALGLAGVSIVDLLFVPNVVLFDTYAAAPLLAFVPVAGALVTLFAFFKVIFAMAAKGGAAAKPAALFKIVTAAAFLPVLFFTFGFEFSSDMLLAPHFAGLHMDLTSLACVVILLGGIFMAAFIRQPSYQIKYDAFDIAKAGVNALAAALFKIDRFMDKILDTWPSKAAAKTSAWISASHGGNTPQYVLWAACGIIVFILLSYIGGAK